VLSQRRAAAATKELIGPPPSGSKFPGGFNASDPFELVLGIDEAGRGSLIGPLVVGGFLIARSEVASLRDLGVRDSKLLTPTRREEVYRELLEAGRCSSVALHPRRIDACVPHHGLNRLEAEAFARLVRRARPAETFVDACDPIAERFGEEVRRLSGAGCPVRASHKADVRLPLVGAASIVAKVRRDRAIARLRAKVGVDLGSGYPSDERTCAFVRSVHAKGGELPSWLRRSWATNRRLKPEPKARPLEEFGR
jgi:ribonuclease HII